MGAGLIALSLFSVHLLCILNFKEFELDRFYD